jgi:hypothetical protein
MLMMRENTDGQQHPEGDELEQGPAGHLYAILSEPFK